MKNEGNLEGLFSSLDKIVEEAKDWEEPAWYGWPGLGVLSYRARQLVADVWVSCLASCCKGGSESCCIFTAMSLGLNHAKNSLICASLGPGSISIHFLIAGMSVPLKWGGQVNSDQSKGLMGCSGHSTCNSRAPLGALCVPGSGPQQTLKVLFGHLGDRLGIVSRNKMLCFCADV